MRAPYRLTWPSRSSAPLSFALRAVACTAALVLLGCSDSSTEPEDPPEALLDLDFGGSFQNCNLISCDFVGSVYNNGPDCAQSIGGTVTFIDSSGDEIGGSFAWSISGRLERFRVGSYTVTGLTAPVTTEADRYLVEATWSAVRC